MKVHIGSTQYEIRKVPNVLEALKKLDPEGCKDDTDELSGYCDLKRAIIWVEDVGDPRREASTLFHEMLHHLHLFDDGDREEETVRHIEDAIFPALWEQGWRPFPKSKRRVAKKKVTTRKRKKSPVEGKQDSADPQPPDSVHSQSSRPRDVG